MAARDAASREQGAQRRSSSAPPALRVAVFDIDDSDTAATCEPYTAPSTPVGTPRANSDSGLTVGTSCTAPVTATPAHTEGAHSTGDRTPPASEAAGPRCTMPSPVAEPTVPTASRKLCATAAPFHARLPEGGPDCTMPHPPKQARQDALSALARPFQAGRSITVKHQEGTSWGNQAGVMCPIPGESAGVYGCLSSQPCFDTPEPPAGLMPFDLPVGEPAGELLPVAGCLPWAVPEPMPWDPPVQPPPPPEEPPAASGWWQEGPPPPPPRAPPATTAGFRPASASWASGSLPPPTCLPAAAGDTASGWPRSRAPPLYHPDRRTGPGRKAPPPPPPPRAAGVWRTGSPTHQSGSCPPPWSVRAAGHTAPAAASAAAEQRMWRRRPSGA
eukprot:TRINITY_DN864_c0_g2_i1.p2 TRINITY_DN864_c0_g2~~TRINITY_DN864_c0_g2_i1.p2  ORF type:complete len:387 (+),score=31.34 TRINITY_DN864_c0_g2_i1:150-1310(+)